LTNPDDLVRLMQLGEARKSAILSLVIKAVTGSHDLCLAFEWLILALGTVFEDYVEMR